MKTTVGEVFRASREFTEDEVDRVIMENILLGCGQKVVLSPKEEKVFLRAQERRSLRSRRQSEGVKDLIAKSNALRLPR